MASRNPFALLAGEGGDDSDNDQQVLPKQSKPAVVDAAPSSKGPARGSIPQTTTSRRTVPGQTTVRPQKEAKELPPTDAPAGSAAQFDGERGRDDRGTSQRGRGGRGRGERGSGRGRGAPRNGRPDRKSATGITDSAKQEHQGWGGDEGKRELEAETAGQTDAAAEKATSTEEATPAADGEASTPAEKQPEAPVEPEDTSKSYEEYLAERKAAGRGVLDTLTSAGGRKANEGSDESQWKDGVLVEKAGEDNYFVGTQKEKAAKQKQRKEKNFLEVEFTAPPRAEAGRGGRGRGDRGTGRGRGERGTGRGRGGAGRGVRGGKANGPVVNVDDSSAFPSLS